MTSRWRSPFSIGKWLAAGAALLVMFAATTPGTSSAASHGACGAGFTGSAFRAFVAAFNHGALERLDGQFAAWPAFRWYSSSSPGKRIGNAAFTRSTLLGYFRSRHLVHDTLRIESFRFNSRSGALRHFSFDLRRSSDDYLGGTWFALAGKGALSCQDGKFVVLSLGGQRPATG